MKVGSTQANAPPVVKQVAEPESPAAKEPLGMEKLSLADEEGAEGAEVQQPEPVHTETEEELAARLEEEARIAEIENKRLKIVIVSSEVAPWSKSGGLADVAEKLSIALSRRGHR
jgi:starch synthase